jgi:multicomponent K+:H+ antiporter subunit E
MKLIHALVFVLIYLWEIVLSTARIAVLVLSPKPRLNPCFVEVPLDLRGELPRFLFACLISMTPGSMSVGLDQENNVLLVHLLDAPDPAAAVAEMKAVFEKPLVRIFGHA